MTELSVLAHAMILAFAGPAAGTPSPVPTLAPASPLRGFIDSIFSVATADNIFGSVAGALILAFAGWLIAKRRRAAKRKHPYWIASATLLHDTLFDELPRAFGDNLIDRIVDRIERGTDLNKDLLRVTRLFTESRLLTAADTGDDTIPPFDELARLIAALQKRLLSGPEPVTFENCFQLDAIRDPGSKYFNSLMKLEQSPPPGVKAGTLTIDRIDRFITPIDVEDGFVAPMFLVTGLLQQFVTAWPGALKGFDKQLGANGVDFTLLQRFELYCWLLWGPSIPACSCEGWAGRFIVLQYGYGDEANSFPLLLDGDVLRKSWTELLREKFDEAFAERGEEAALPLAFAAKVQGTLVWGPRYEIKDDTDYPGIYSVATNEAGRARLPNGEATILNGLVLYAAAISWLVERRRYYSAYMWVMFEVYRHGEPPPANPAERWRRLYPIFEHTNIANGETMLFLKRRLAEKACRTVEEIEAIPGANLRMRYLCATDDPGTVAPDDHGAHLFRFRPDKTKVILRDDAFRGGAQPAKDVLLAGLSPNEKHRMRSIMYDLLPDDAKRARIFAPAADPDAVITACDLPQIIEDFYRSFARPSAPA